jgi:hypothetical protein
MSHDRTWLPLLRLSLVALSLEVAAAQQVLARSVALRELDRSAALRG